MSHPTTINRFRAVPILPILIIGLALSTPAAAYDVLWSNPASSYGESVLSVVYPSPAVDSEAADDFEAHGSVERLLVNGRNDCTFGCYQPPQPTGLWIRFYEWTPSGPGALQEEQLLTPGTTPGFLYDTVEGAKTLDVTLPQPFVADGWHFLSVQPVFDEPFNWRRYQSHHLAPVNSNALVRDNVAGGGWQIPTDYWGNPVTQDFAFTLYGCPPGGCDAPPTVAECGEWNEIPSPNPPGDLRDSLGRLRVDRHERAVASGSGRNSVHGRIG